MSVNLTSPTSDLFTLSSAPSIAAGSSPALFIAGKFHGCGSPEANIM